MGDFVGGVQKYTGNLVCTYFLVLNIRETLYAHVFWSYKALQVLSDLKEIVSGFI